MQREEEVSFCLSFSPQYYAHILSLFRMICNQHAELYSQPRFTLKTLFGKRRHDNSTTNPLNNDLQEPTLRCIQDDIQFMYQYKVTMHTTNFVTSTILERSTCQNLVYILNVRYTMSHEYLATDFECINEIYMPTAQIERYFTYIRSSGVRICVERKFTDCKDPLRCNTNEYDSWNRCDFTCTVHVELEGNEKKIAQFFTLIKQDPLIVALLNSLATHNINCVGDEIPMLQTLQLTHPYGSTRLDRLTETPIYLSKKFDGKRENFFIYGNIIQIGTFCMPFNCLFFGQVIVGHAEIMTNGIVLHDLYLVEENFSDFVRRMQNGRRITNINDLPNITSAEYYNRQIHAQSLYSPVMMINHLKAIEILQVLDTAIWPLEPIVRGKIQIQKFYDSIDGVVSNIKDSDQIDGMLVFTPKRIWKIKTENTIDLLLRLEDMHKEMLRELKKKKIPYAELTKQRTMMVTIDFSRCSPIYYMSRFLFFAKSDPKKSFHTHFPDWTVEIRNLVDFESQLDRFCGTVFTVVLEFNVDPPNKRLIFKNVRLDKFNVNAISVFNEMLLLK